jgi:hypothetical protein
MAEDQRAKWKQVLDAHASAQRTQRGRRRDASAYRPGMARITPAATGEPATV